MKSLVLALIACLLPVCAFAAEPVTLQPDTGYVLVRTFQVKGRALSGSWTLTPLLYRVLGAGELSGDRIESNVVEPAADQPYAVDNSEVFLLAPLRPGTYVLGGLAGLNWVMGMPGFAVTSLCMGTVSFEVKPGVITDLGAILAAWDDAPTDIPELSNIVTGKPVGIGATPYIAALRPRAMELPDALRSLPRVAADYRAAAAFANFSGAPLSRLAPLAGVLDYDKDGHVVDLKAPGGP